MAALPDGMYDAIVIEAEPTDDGDVRVEMTITLGPEIGRVIALRSRHIDSRGRRTVAQHDPVDLLGTPGTLIVRNGNPTFRPELA